MQENGSCIIDCFSAVVAATFFLIARDLDVNYLVDEAVMEEIPEMSPDWRAEADLRIHTVRKNNIRIK